MAGTTAFVAPGGATWPLLSLLCTVDALDFLSE